ncbi:hypothetical protein GCM10027275_53080 [Rhabdobacter roseus]|uniref:Lipoprotein n=1 Tax=Rhabdobacter roseus TaxID=1655419 RepID=A0A840TR01_9BACT|nr:hypothetical protein [Rhabdobacter roseus]MBB5286301.1 hypothetical protein [Rhabdobacter roseus]
MKLILKLTPVLWLMALACQSASEQSTLDTDARLLAYLQCEARQLKEQRFRVANDLRFREDSLLRLHLALTELEKKQADSVKQVLTAQTEQLAAKITQTMDSLFAAHYQSLERRRELDVATERLVQEVCR